MISSVWARLISSRGLPVAPAPETVTPSRAMLLACAMLFVGFCGDVLRYTIGWVGYLIVVLALVVMAGVLYARRRPQVRIFDLPYLLVGFMLWCWLSTIWSRYPLETIIGSMLQTVTAAGGVAMAVSLGRFQFLRSFGVTMRMLVFGSLLFELFAAILSPGGVVPPVYLHTDTLGRLLGNSAPTSAEEIPGSFYWTHSQLFAGGPLQGLMGNRNLLAFVALLAIIVTLAEVMDGFIGRTYATVSILAATAALLLTDSATAYVALAFVLLGASLVAIGRRVKRRHRWLLYASVGTLLVAGAVVVVANNNAIFAAMNRSSDMSGRGTIWHAVIELGSSSPILGLGWVSYWAPWVPEFSQLAVIDGVAYHQAHNAFLDAWMQTGVVGLLLLAGVVATTLIRTWWLAIDLHDVPLMPLANRERMRASMSAAVPFLLMVALVVQAMTESRLLVEGDWLLLSYLAIFAKFRSANAPLRPRAQGTVTHANENLALDLRVR